MPPNQPNNIWFERRHGRIHLGFIRIQNWKIITFFTRVGLGISYVPSLGTWDHEQGLIYEPIQNVQTQLDQVFMSSYKLKSLEVRSRSDTLHYSNLNLLTDLRSLYIMGPLADAPDLSKNRKLRLLAGSHRTIQNVTGIELLTSLRYVYVDRPLVKWINSLPKGLTKIHVTGSWSGTLPINRFLRLKKLVLEGRGILDLQNLESSESVNKIAIFGFRELRKIETIQTLFPNLRKIYVANLGPKSLDAISCLLKQGFVIRDLGGHR